MPVYEILEFIMMICFGFSWPFSCYRSWKSRSTKGKSLIFSILIAIGYACGIAAKILAGNFNLAFYIYWPNITLVISHSYNSAARSVTVNFNRYCTFFSLECVTH